MGQPLDTHEAAVRMGLAASTLRKLRVTGQGPVFLKLGRAVRYREGDIDKWLNARSARSTSEAPGKLISGAV